MYVMVTSWPNYMHCALQPQLAGFMKAEAMYSSALQEIDGRPLKCELRVLQGEAA